MIVIVGRGPSIYSGLGSVIDEHFVVRLKEGLPKKVDSKHWGSRTDAICARSLIYRKADFTGDFWHFADIPRWLNYYREFSHAKPSTGLCAVFCAIDRGHKDIALIGFDYLLRPDTAVGLKAHDMRSENAALKKLDANIKDLKDVEVHRHEPGLGSGDLGGLDLRGSPSTVPLPTGRGAGVRTRQVRAPTRSRGHQAGEEK